MNEALLNPLSPLNLLLLLVHTHSKEKGIDPHHMSSLFYV